MPAKGSPESFVLEVQKFAEKAKVAPLDVARETIQDINEEIVRRTPVVTGFLRGSWFASINSLPTGTGGSGGDSAYRLNLPLLNLDAGDVYYAGNTARYARRLEYGFVGQDALGRNYNQRGRFWVKRVLDDAPRIAEEAARRVASRQ